MRAVAVAVVFVLSALASACQGPAHKDGDAASASDPPGVCTRLGTPCTVSPGKLGTCVEVEQTSGPSAFVCQSQH